MTMIEIKHECSKKLKSIIISRKKHLLNLKEQFHLVGCHAPMLSWLGKNQNRCDTDTWKPKCVRMTLWVGFLSLLEDWECAYSGFLNFTSMLVWYIFFIFEVRRINYWHISWVSCVASVRLKNKKKARQCNYDVMADTWTLCFLLCIYFIIWKGSF